MRKAFLTAAAVAGFAAAGALSHPAVAMTISTPAAVQHAIDSKGLTEQVRYVCRRVWTGWGWRRSCWWRPSYGYRHHYRYGHHRHYRHHHRHRHHYSYRYY
jgi:hypothetical protein